MNFFGALSSQQIDPAKAALIFNDKIISYKDFFHRIESAAAALNKIGIKENDKVALLGKNSDEYVISVFALWRIGALPVPLNTRMLQAEIYRLLEFTGCKFLLHDDSFFPNDAKTNFKSINFLFKREIGITNNFNLEIDLQKPALILFTSGSTGKPKGVVLSFNNLVRSAEAGNQIFHHDETDKWLAALPFYHVGGFSIIARNFLYGCTLIIPGSRENNGIKNALINFNPTLTSFVTTQLKRLVDAGIKPNPSLKHVLLGGGFIDTSLVEKAISNGWPVSKSYGATETSSFVTALTKEEFKNKPDSAGKALNPNQILIVDDNKNILPPNLTGEIAIKSDAVALEYFNNEEESLRRFSNGIYYTGDSGRLDTDGYLFVEARRNDLIISGGENINPVEIENEILKHPLIIEAAVFGLDNEEWGQSVCAAIVTKDSHKILLDELNSFLSNKIPSFKLPKKIFIIDELPKTELGKIQKEKLKEVIQS